MFEKKFEDSNINLEKFNLVSELEHPGIICDNFYLFPFRVLKKFQDIVKSHIDRVSFHYIKPDIDKIEGPGFVNYILNEETLVRFLSFYKIVRDKIG